MAEIFTLTDQDDETPGSTALFTHAVHGALLLRPEGYGDHCSKDGDGWPIMIERFQGRLRVIVWADINQEDPTHTIDLEEARETNRQDEEVLDDPELPAIESAE